MAETSELIKLMQKQQQQQMEQHQQQMEMMQQQLQQSKEEHQQSKEEHQRQMDALIDRLAPAKAGAVSGSSTGFAIPVFMPFDSSTELWTDYLARFTTFVGANSVPADKVAQVFLTNQTSVIYKLLANLAGQAEPPRDINTLKMDEITEYMMEQYHPKRFIVRERFKFWSKMERKPGETVQALVARIRHDAVTCDFPSITSPLDEAMRTRFVCSVNNEAVLKALFKVKDDELTFVRAIEIATEVEDAAKVAKETVYGARPQIVNKVHQKARTVVAPLRKPSVPSHSRSGHRPGSFVKSRPSPTCFRCGATHLISECRLPSTVTCTECQRRGHTKLACRATSRQVVKTIRALPINVNRVTAPEWQQRVRMADQTVTFEVDSGSSISIVSKDVWKKLGAPSLKTVDIFYQSASKHPLPVLGRFSMKAQLSDQLSRSPRIVEFIVVETEGLVILGREAISILDVPVAKVRQESEIMKIFDSLHPDLKLQKACQDLCKEVPNIFKPELGCLKDYELEVKFKSDARPVFCRPRPVPLAIQEDLSDAYEVGIKRGVWEATSFNAYGTPVVPIRKVLLPGQTKAKVRVCGDYSATVNPQLETHRYPMPLPEELMQKLGGGYGFTKIDLADAYNQIPLAPASQKKLALSTHRGVLLQKRLPFGISSAPGYFQEIMDSLTADLPGVAVYLDDILVSGTTAEDHINNLRKLLQRLDQKGLRCRLEKCSFAQPAVEYLGHQIAHVGIAKGYKVEAVLKMPAPKDISTLQSFLGSVQFYGKFLPNLSDITEPLNRLKKKGVPWNWGPEQEKAFQKLKEMLCEDTVLAHFDSQTDIGIACDASNVGIGSVLFHRYQDGSERPIAHVSKTLTDTQRKYSQIQKEALSIIFALKKFHQYLYGRHFILVTDHKPLLALFGPTKATPALAANRLARWALCLSQYDYSIEYRRTKDHGNADVLSRLPLGPDTEFDGAESGEDVDTVCLIKTINRQLDASHPGVLAKETAKDRVIATVLRYTREGWPPGKKKELDSPTVAEFKKLADSLSFANGCLFYGARVVIPESLRAQVLQILHLGHFGMQRMKQLARTAVYWPGIEADIVDLCHSCVACAEHANKPAKPAIHPWMLPEKPWSRLHIDHAINFLGSNWLVLIDAQSKYPCIHPTSSTSSKATIDLLEQDFAHFGYPHTLVSDNATTFMSEEFQEYCRSRGIIHLTGAPYHPATNGAAERLVQTFKNALKKSSLPPKQALQEFLMLYRRTPLAGGMSPSELLNGRQIRTKIDTLTSIPAIMAQRRQSKEAAKSQAKEAAVQEVNLIKPFKVGTPCYAQYFGPRHDKKPRWVPAIVVRVFGSRSVNVRVFPRGPTWRRHVEQLCHRYGAKEDNDPGEVPVVRGRGAEKNVPEEGRAEVVATAEPVVKVKRPNWRLPVNSQYGPGNPRRSARLQLKVPE